MSCVLYVPKIYYIPIHIFFIKCIFGPQILTRHEVVNFAAHSLGMPYSVITADQECRTEMVKAVVTPEITSTISIITTTQYTSYVSDIDDLPIPIKKDLFDELLDKDVQKGLCHCLTFFT